MCEVSGRDSEPVAYSCYEAMAEAYAASVDEAPYNAYYERPAVVSLLPPLEGLNIFDAGCGSGWYAAYLVDRGARVMAVDSSPKMVSFTRQRLRKRADVRLADLGQPLEFAADNSFDLVLCPLVMHYLKDWEAVFTEFGRILKPGGRLIFSTHHPTMDYQLFKVDSYFDTVLVEDEWRVGKVRFYRRPLTAMIDALALTGFWIERILEPQPSEAFRDVDPEGYQKLKTQPWFIVIRALRAGE
jgi:SAM-dependent methyltransferase